MIHSTMKQKSKSTRSVGKPKPRLTIVQEKPKVFRVNWALLRSIPIVEGGKTSEEIIREDRASRP